MPNLTVNVKRLVGNIGQTNVYDPIVEAVVNSIDAIEDSKNDKGEITVELIRENVLKGGIGDGDDNLSPISSIKITDNGVGFNDKNISAFNEIYTENKVLKGGKGFGRFVFLKYFENVSIRSVYVKDDRYFIREFEFVAGDQIIKETKNEEVLKKTKTYTEVLLSRFVQKHKHELDKQVKTISRRVLERLLLFFVLDNYNCPTIIIKDEEKSEILNDFIGKNLEIQQLKSNNFALDNSDGKGVENFKAKVFKIFYGQSRSSVSLVAHNRQVTETALYEHIPDFKGDFRDKDTNRNYTIKVYITGEYLNDNVSPTRERFLFGKSPDAFYKIGQTDIEKEGARLGKESIKEELQKLHEWKISKINEYILNKAPWHTLYVSKLNFSLIPPDFNEEDLEMELQKIKFNDERENKEKIINLLDGKSININDAIAHIVSNVTDASKSDLIHYVSNRKVILGVIKKLLTRSTAGKTSLEKEVHNVIFPMGKDSTDTTYEDHNLWVLDERLVFSHFIASDKPMGLEEKDRPDILVFFDNKLAFRRGENEFGNPLTIFEFKRPKREDYDDSENPLLQVGRYLDKIKSGKYEMPNGYEKIKVNEHTPVSAYIVCDITPKIVEFAEKHFSLTKSPDGEGYFGYMTGYNMYVEISSFSKLVKDAEMRNKIFFAKLKIESDIK